MVVASFGGANGRFNYSMPYPHFEEIRRRNTTLSGIFATNPFGQVNVTYGGDAAIAVGTYVSGDYYETLRSRLRRPALDANDDRPGVEVAVLSHRYWQGASPAAATSSARRSH